jgi:AraC-like DNA-binding protein
MSLDLRSFPCSSRVESECHAYEAPHLYCERGINSVLNRHLHNALRSCPATDWRAECIRRFVDAQNGALGWNINRISVHLKLGVSGPCAARLFGVQTGVGFREYATKRRLIRAAELLRETTRSVHVIATALGYRTPSDLQRQFKRLFHLNPTEFRAICKRQSVAASMIGHHLQQQILDFLRERV